MKIYVDGNVVRNWEDIPERFYPFVRKKVDTYNSMLLASGNLGQSPILRLYTTTGTSTETTPGGYANAHIQLWGPGAGGNVTFNPGTLGGGGGGGGAYSECDFPIASQPNKTLIVVIGTGGGTATGVTVFAGTSQISAGSITGFSTITCRGAQSGQNQNGGLGGTATNANSGATNQNGNNGATAVSAIGGTGGPGIAGDTAGDGSPYGAGGHGQPGGAPDKGNDGGAAFYYTS